MKREENNKPVNVFTCLTCKENPTFSHKDFILHVEKQHGFKPKQGKRLMSMHMDGSDWFSSDYSWEFIHEGVIVKANQFVRCSREMDDPMRAPG